MTRRRRSGGALLEVIVAMTIIATAGLAIVAGAREAVHVVERARTADRQLARASAFLEVVALWPREDLDLRLGERIQGEWRLRIERPLPTLYTVSLIKEATGEEILQTSLYRVRAPHADP